MRKGVTAAVVNLDAATTGDFTRAPDLAFPPKAATGDRRRRRPGRAGFVDAGRLAARWSATRSAPTCSWSATLGRRGCCRSREAIERAIEINGVQVDFNLQAFLWGRRAPTIWPPSRRVGQARPSDRPAHAGRDRRPPGGLPRRLPGRGLRRRYRAIVARVREQEAKRVPGRTTGRGGGPEPVQADGGQGRVRGRPALDRRLVPAQLGGEFESWDWLEVHLAPLLLAKRDPATGHRSKRRYGPWMFRRSACWPCQAAARHRARRSAARPSAAWSAGCCATTRSCSTSCSRTRSG